MRGYSLVEFVFMNISGGYDGKGEGGGISWAATSTIMKTCLTSICHFLSPEDLHVLQLEQQPRLRH